MVKFNGTLDLSTMVRAAGRPHIILLGNEKGGTGKSTAALHLIVALLQRDYTVGSIDLDGRQGTLSRYLERRVSYMEATGWALPVPLHHRIEPSKAPLQAASESRDQARLGQALAALSDMQFVVIDTPGSDCFLSRLGHGYADTLITPLNDSFLDLDVLADLDVQRRVVRAPSVYSKMVWEQSSKRRAAGRAPIDWIVLRNRQLHVATRNKCQIADLLDQLAGRIGFRQVAGFGERVVFRELFHKGLTVLDITHDTAGRPLTASQEAACREIHGLLDSTGVIQAAAA